MAVTCRQLSVLTLTTSYHIAPPSSGCLSDLSFALNGNLLPKIGWPNLSCVHFLLGQAMRAIFLLPDKCNRGRARTPTDGLN
jgi:hypothetical protein